MKDGVRFDEDILREVAEDEGLGKDEIKEIFRIHKKYVKSLMDDKDVTIISLPYLGNLYFNARYFNLLNYRSTKKEQYIDQKEKAEKVLKAVEEDKNRDIKTKYDYPQYSRTGLLRLSRAIRKFFKGNYKRNKGKVYNIELLENHALGLIKEEDFTE